MSKEPLTLEPCEALSKRVTPCSPGALTLTIIVPPPLLVREQVEKKRRKSKEQ